jgi:hypothetical protein
MLSTVSASGRTASADSWAEVRPLEALVIASCLGKSVVENQFRLLALVTTLVLDPLAIIIEGA